MSEVKKRSKTKSIKHTTDPFDETEGKIIPVADIPLNLKVLVYGRSGTGKTHFAGTAPTPVLVLDIKEKGTDTIRNREGVFVLPIETWQDFEEAFWYLDSNRGTEKFQGGTIVIETVTQLQDLALEQVTGGTDGMISRRAWGEAAGLMKTWIMLYRDLPYNVIFVAQDRQTESEEDLEDADGMILPEVGPYVMPSVAKALNAAVGTIGQTFIRERLQKVKSKENPEAIKTRRVVEYCMRTGPHARYLTKLRVDPDVKIPDVLVDPSFNKLLELTKGGTN